MKKKEKKKRMKRTRQYSFLLPCEYIATSGSCGRAAGQPTSSGPRQGQVPADTKSAELGSSALPALGLHGAQGRGARTWRAAECMRRRRCSRLQLPAARCATAGAILTDRGQALTSAAVTGLWICESIPQSTGKCMLVFISTKPASQMTLE